MNELLFKKLDELCRVMDNDDQVKELLEIKKQIYQDDNLKEQLEKYKNSSNKYDASLVTLKSNIINNPLIKRYRELENELYFMILEINKKLNSIVDKKGCSSESY